MEKDMASVFGDYAHYYNLLYADKDYSTEAAFVLSLLRCDGHNPHSLLDLGCGTGRHAYELAKQGLAVTGVDLSPTMLDMGRQTIAALPKGSITFLPELHEGDARTVRLGQQFDAVTSLFHVMSYQNTEEDALALLRTAAAHLSEGGRFLFDFWYGPCVLKERPEHRNKVMENDTCRVEREAAPTLDLSANIVTVHYDVHLAYKNGQADATLTENHHMRYWFLPELRFLAQQAGFTYLKSGGWLKNSAPTDADWGAWMLVEKQ